MEIKEKAKKVVESLLQYNLVESEESFYSQIGIKPNEGIFINEIKRAYDVFNINPNFWFIDNQPIFHLSISDNVELDKVKTLVIMLKSKIDHERYMRKLAEGGKETYFNLLKFHKLLPVDIGSEEEISQEEEIDYLQLA